MTVKDASVVLFPIHYKDLSSKNKCCYHICSVYCNAACSVLVLRQWGKARSRRAEWHKEQHYSLRYSLHHSHILCNLSLLSPNCVRLQIIKCPCLSKPPWELNRGNTCTVPPLPSPPSWVTSSSPLLYPLWEVLPRSVPPWLPLFVHPEENNVKINAMTFSAPKL